MPSVLKRAVVCSGMCITALFVCLMVGCKPELKKGAEDAWHQNGGVRSAVYGVALGADKQTCVKEFAKYDFQIKYDEDTLVCFQKGANHEAFMYDGVYYRYLRASIQDDKVTEFTFTGTHDYDQCVKIYERKKPMYAHRYYLREHNGELKYITARDKEHKHYFFFGIRKGVSAEGDSVYCVDAVYKEVKN